MIRTSSHVEKLDYTSSVQLYKGYRTSRPYPFILYIFRRISTLCTFRMYSSHDRHQRHRSLLSDVSSSYAFQMYPFAYVQTRLTTFPAMDRYSKSDRSRITHR